MRSKTVLISSCLLMQTFFAYPIYAKTKNAPTTMGIAPVEEIVEPSFLKVNDFKNWVNKSRVTLAP